MEFVREAANPWGQNVLLGIAWDLVWVAVVAGVAFVALGAAAGLVLAVALSSTLEAFMFEVSARDPLVYSIAPLVLLGIAGLSSYLPALRATNIDPVESFRAD